MTQGYSKIGFCTGDAKRMSEVFRWVTEISRENGAEELKKHLDGAYYLRRGFNPDGEYDIYRASQVLEKLGGAFMVADGFRGTQPKAGLQPLMLPTLMLETYENPRDIAAALVKFALEGIGTIKPALRPQEGSNPFKSDSIKEKKRPLVGVAGGWGPIAGIDAADYLANSSADVLLTSTPSFVGRLKDEFTYMLENFSKQSGVQPKPWRRLDGTSSADILADIILQMDKGGCQSAFIACNTLHIHFDEVEMMLKQKGGKLKLVHALQETIESLPPHTRIAVLGTKMTVEHALLESARNSTGRKDVSFIFPDEGEQKGLENAIWGDIHSGHATVAQAAIRQVAEEMRRPDDGFSPVLFACSDIWGVMKDAKLFPGAIDTMQYASAAAERTAIKMTTNAGMRI